MVRDSSGQSCNQPYTLVVFYKGRIYNIPIRSMEGKQQYALGKEGKNHEEFFTNVDSIIHHYQNVPLVLIGNSSSLKEQTCLLYPVRP
ncbi:SH2 domain-containing protein 6 [Pleurodeles waltl]